MASILFSFHIWHVRVLLSAKMESGNAPKKIVMKVTGLSLLLSILVFTILSSNQIFAQEPAYESVSESQSATDEPCKRWEGSCSPTGDIWRSGRVGIGANASPGRALVVSAIEGESPNYMGIDVWASERAISAVSQEAIYPTLTAANLEGGQAANFSGKVYAEAAVDGIDEGVLTVNNPSNGMALRVLGQSFLSGTTGIVGQLAVQNQGDVALLVTGDGEINGTLEVDVLHATENLYSKEVHVMLPPFPDYVFEKDYPLMSLHELEVFIQENKRLPNMPSADEVAENGAELGDMQVRLTEKVEELTLYILEMNKRLEKLEEENERLKGQIQEERK